MNANLRRGVLGTLFGGGLPALSCTAANAADSTSGSDLFASALIPAAASADSTSLGLLGGPTPAVSADVAAVTDHSATDLAAAADAVVDLGTGTGELAGAHANLTVGKTATTGTGPKAELLLPAPAPRA